MLRLRGFLARLAGQQNSASANEAGAANPSPLAAMASSAAGGNTDQPIYSHQQDRLNRLGFAARVVGALIVEETSLSSGQVIGLAGPWGSGKSSLLNLVSEEIERKFPDAVVVRFDPWILEGRNSLVEEFFKELSAKIVEAPRLRTRAKNLVGVLGSYAQRVSKIADVATLAIAGLPVPGIGSAIDSAGKQAQAWAEGDVSLTGLRKKLQHLLSEARVPIVVLIDELDRVEDADVRTVAQLVRAVADFPAISYLLAYDYDRVVQALSPSRDEHERGRSYLEKIVQLQVPIPVAFREELQDLLLEELKPIWTALPQAPSDERVSAALDKLFPFFISTTRDLKRIVGSYRALMGMLSHEVDAIDLLIYSTILVKRPDVIDVVRNNIDLFATDTLSLNVDEQRAHDAAGFLTDHLKAPVPLGLIRALTFIFPAIGDQEAAQINDAICRRRRLATVVRLGTPPGGVSRLDVAAIASAHSEGVPKLLNMSIHQGTLPALLERVDDLFGRMPGLRSAHFWIGISRWLLDQEEQSLPASERRNWARYCSEIFVGHGRRATFAANETETILNALVQISDHSVLPHILRSEIFAHGLFGSTPNQEAPFLPRNYTADWARTLAASLRSKHIGHGLLRRLLDVEPLAFMIEVGAWDGPASQELLTELSIGENLDFFARLLFGPGYATEKSFVERIVPYSRLSELAASRLLELPPENSRYALERIAGKEH